MCVRARARACLCVRECYLTTHLTRNSQVLTAGDFGPSGNYSEALAGQRQMNPPGLAPKFCSEYYSGWYTAWGYGFFFLPSSARASKLCSEYYSGSGNTTRTPTRQAVETLEAMLADGTHFQKCTFHILKSALHGNFIYRKYTKALTFENV